MSPEIARPEIMKDAKVDLAGHLRGQFSPEDWEQILVRAEASYRHELAKSDVGQIQSADREIKAWQEVVRDFNLNGYWGFVANHKPARVKREKKKTSLGMSFIWITFNAMVLSKVLLLWFGQLAENSGEVIYSWILYALIVGFVVNIGFFLWKNRDYVD